MEVSVKVNTREFNRHLSTFANKYKKQTDRFIKQVAFGLLDNVKSSSGEGKDGTPVDTGHARGKWRIAPWSRGAFKGWRIWNNTDYIRVLEFGGYVGKGPKTVMGKQPFIKNYVSKQAPKGMLRINLAKAAKRIKKAVK